MKKLDIRKATLVEVYNICDKHGFANATDDNLENNYFQCCISNENVINAIDCGYNWGVCGDYNESVGNCNEESLKIFLKLAKKSGINVINEEYLT